MSSSSINASSLIDTAFNDTEESSAARIAHADGRFAALVKANNDAKNELAEITQGGATGYWAWQIKKMREKATDEVMTSMNLTPEKIAAMDDKERVATEEKIEQLVEQMVKQEIAEDSKKKQQQTIVASASMRGIITHAQSIQEQITKKDRAVATSNPSDLADMLLFGS